MRLYATIAAAVLLSGCGSGPATGGSTAGGPQMTVTGPSEAVASFVRNQGAQRPSRATTFPETVGEGRSSARVMMPAGTGAATMQALAEQASKAGLSVVVAVRH